MKIHLKQCSDTGMQLQEKTQTLIVDRPISKGGNGKGLMGGQYFLTGIAGCFCSTLLDAAKLREVTIEGLEVHLTALESTEKPNRFQKIILEVNCKESSNIEMFPKLLLIAERGCMAVNSIKNSIDFKVISNKK